MLGKITGRVTTTQFRFLVEGEAKKFGYVRVRYSNGEFVLGQILEIEKKGDREVADCLVLGYRDDNKLKGLRRPLEPGSGVYRAEDDFVKETLGLNGVKNGAYFGNLEGRDKLKIFLDLNKILTKHLCVLAKSGSGKSYSVGVLLEELLERKVPVVVIDPHGEYSSLKYPNENEKEKLKKFGFKSQGYIKQIQEFSPNVIDNPEAKPLKLSSRNLEPREILHLLPAKLSNAQLGILYSALKQIDKVDLDSLIFALDTEEGNMKWTLINIVEYLKKLDLFTDVGTSLNEIVQNGKLSIINLRGVASEVQEVIVYKLLNDLFNERKKGNIQPFFLVIEEAQNYSPERGFGEAKSSSILRQIASVDYLEPVLIKKGKKNYLFSIGEFIDDLIESSDVKPDKNGFEILKLPRGYSTPAFDKNLKISYKNIKKVIRHKIKEYLYEITLEKGKKVKVTASHSVFVFKDNMIKDIPTSLINEGDYVIVPLSIPCPDTTIDSIEINNDQKKRSFKLPSSIPLTKEFMTLLGYYVSEGSCGSFRLEFTLHIKETIYEKEIVNALKEVFGVDAIVRHREELSRIDIMVCKRSLSELFSQLCGNCASNKIVPWFLFSVSDDLKSAFIRACFNGDGYLRSRKGDKGGKHLEISYKTVSKKLAESLSYLLLTLGIPSSIYEISVIELGHQLVYQLVIQNKTDCRKLLNILKKNKHHNAFKRSLSKKYKNTYSLESLIPTEPFRFIYKLCKPIASDDTINERMCIRRKRANRKDLLKFLDYIKRKSRFSIDNKVLDFLEKLCNSHIGFLKVKKIEKVKSSSEYVYDLSIGESENFISGRGGIILHNSEGRKFGLGLCVVSQRPSRLDKSVISQCGTQIILKVTNPNDVKAISNSVEGITLETEKEIVNLPIGNAMITGIVDMPLFVEVRPRKSKHGGDAVNILEFEEETLEEKDFDEQIKEFKEEGDVLPLIKQKISIKDYKIMNGVKDVKVNLVPCVMFSCSNEEDFQLLINLNNGELITNVEKGNGVSLIRKMDLKGNQANLFNLAMNMKIFTAAELFAKGQVQFSEVYDIVNTLVNKGYFVKENDRFKISKIYDIYNKLKEFKCYEKVEYFKIDGEKINKRYDLNEFENSLKNYVKINNVKECWLVIYI